MYSFDFYSHRFYLLMYREEISKVTRIAFPVEEIIGFLYIYHEWPYVTVLPSSAVLC